MKSFSSKKYFTICCIYFSFFILSVFLGLFFSCLNKPVDLLLGLSLGIIIGGILFLPPATCYLISFFVYDKKSRKVTPIIGTISNWGLGFFRFLGNISITVDDKTYSTPSYMGKDEASELVGKNVSYCILNDTLYIFKVLN